jgi:hypothetical protein
VAQRVGNIEKAWKELQAEMNRVNEEMALILTPDMPEAGLKKALTAAFDHLTGLAIQAGITAGEVREARRLLLMKGK